MGVVRKNYELNRVRQSLVFAHGRADFSVSSSSGSATSWIQFILASGQEAMRGDFDTETTTLSGDTIKIRIPGIYRLELSGQLLATRASGTSTISAAFTPHVNGVTRGANYTTPVYMGGPSGALLRENFHLLNVLALDRDDLLTIEAACTGPSGVAWTIGDVTEFRYLLQRLGS